MKVKKTFLLVFIFAIIRFFKTSIVLFIAKERKLIAILLFATVRYLVAAGVPSLFV